MSVAEVDAPRRVIRAPRGPERTCKGWIQEAALRMLMNNLDPDVAEDPDHLVVYGGSGKAARSWEAFVSGSASGTHASHRTGRTAPRC